MPAEAPRPERDEAFLHNAAQIADQFDREEQPLHAATVRFILARLAQAERRAEEAERLLAEIALQPMPGDDGYAYPCDDGEEGDALNVFTIKARNLLYGPPAALTAAAKGTGADET